MEGKTVLLDGYSLIYRAFHALQSPMSAPDGTPTNAVHGFVMMVLKVIEDERPDRLAVAFDVHAPTNRALRYAPYKATRKPMPEELRAQVPVIRELIGLMHIPILEKEGWEADDILGTVSAICEREGGEALLVTGDRDAFQLAGEHTTILYTKKGITDTVRVTPGWIRDTYGVGPAQMIDVKGLMGDTSDNIPGVPGVGEKTALKLIAQYGSLEEVLDRADTEQKGKLRERLMEHAELARLSYSLATIDRAAPIEPDFEAMRVTAISDALPRLKELGMYTAARRLGELTETLPGHVPAPGGEPRTDLSPIERPADLPALAARVRELAEDAAWAAVHVGTDITVATDSARLALPMGGDLLSPGITPVEAGEALMPLLERDCPKDLWDLKGFPVEPERIRGEVTDVMLAAYALDPQRPSFEAGRLCEAEGIDEYAAHPASAIHMLAVRQREQLLANDLDGVYRDIELPLARVLRNMERTGFPVDAEKLRVLGETFRTHIAALVEEIAEMAGERVNLNSPKQLGEMLFGRMRLPSPKKTSRGWSTSAEVLEGLADRYPICEKILEYRKYQKLESTYIQSLTEMRDAEGRVHTRFDQVATATGRISSSEPNLQNIPVRTELGKAIRGAFVASPGCVLVDADYSQIELRVLAHISGDETMIDAFRADQDIHARTAAEVYGVPIEKVTPAMRSSCKAVNFGIVYGISDFTLAKNIGVSRAEARDFIDRYFERYPGVKRYMDRAVEEGRARGYVTTLMHRRRYLPELSSANYNLRSFGERCAMNSPIQGTAADIIKLAMIDVDRALREQGLKARLLLQVHDELIIEAPEDEQDRVVDLLRGCMENVMRLEVPLKTDISVGGDWRACK